MLINQLIKYIIYIKMLDTIMHYAAYKNNKELLSYLISKNADPSIKNSVKI